MIDMTLAIQDLTPEDQLNLLVNQMRTTLPNQVERKVCWRIVRRCNLHCIHCLAGHKNVFRSDMTPAEQRNSLIKIAAAGVTRITWTGGEPTICRTLPNLLSMCADHQISSVLTTHGLSITSNLISNLRPAHDTIRFSFDGMEETHNMVRGGRFFAKTLTNLRMLRDMGFRIEANISIMSINVHDVPDLVEFLQQEGITKIVLLTLMARESSVDNHVAVASPTECRDMNERLRLFQANYPGTRIVLNDYGTSSDMYIVIESDGEILLCSESDEDVGVGNILLPNGVSLLSRALNSQTLDHRVTLDYQRI